MHCDDIGGHGDQAHRREVFQLPGQLVHQDRIGNVVTRIRHQQGVTVFGTAGHGLVGQVAAGPGLVVHHHRLPDHAGQRLGHQTRRCVHQAAGRVGHDQADRFAGEGLGQHSQGGGQCQNGGEGEASEVFHVGRQWVQRMPIDKNVLGFAGQAAPVLVLRVHRAVQGHGGFPAPAGLVHEGAGQRHQIGVAALQHGFGLGRLGDQAHGEGGQA